MGTAGGGVLSLVGTPFYMQEGNKERDLLGSISHLQSVQGQFCSRRKERERKRWVRVTWQACTFLALLHQRGLTLAAASSAHPFLNLSSLLLHW